MAGQEDIEDVLSSIRRLVADEVAQQGRKGPLVGANDERAPTERLVLGEAQRVVEPEDPFQAIRALAQEERDARDAGTFAPALAGEGV